LLLLRCILLLPFVDCCCWLIVYCRSLLLSWLIALCSRCYYVGVVIRLTFVCVCSFVVRCC
jgi:hypothetical protein